MKYEDITHKNRPSIFQGVQYLGYGFLNKDTVMPYVLN
jgi:hypothetical protein